MKPLTKLHPSAQFLYFCALLIPVCLGNDPMFFLPSLLSGLLFCLMMGYLQKKSGLAVPLFLLLLSVFLNICFVQKGSTVLLFVGNHRITLESLLYGAFTGMLLSGVCIWFYAFRKILTSDRLLCVFGLFSPKVALVFSMALRYTALFSEQAEKVRETQTALGLFREDRLFSRLRGELRVFSVMVTWTLENGIITAESMEARGYGVFPRKKASSPFTFTRNDGIFLLGCLFLSTFSVFSIAASEQVSFYPTLTYPAFSALRLTGGISYLFLCLYPIFAETEERIKWRYYLSKM